MQTKSLVRRIADWEENKWNDIVERSAEQNPEWFWNDDYTGGPGKGPRRGFASWMLDKWPRWLTFGYWYWLFAYLGGGPNELGYSTGYETKGFLVWPTWGEWRYLFRDWKGRWQSPHAIWMQLYDESSLQRLVCRLRGHPNGEVYYNSYGDEPDHHCKDCGEIIG